VFNYGRFQGKYETKSGLAVIFIKIENKKYFPEANFYKRQAYGITQSHGLRCFNSSPFLLASARIFIFKQITPPLRGGKVIFFHFMLKYTFFKKITFFLVDKIKRKDYYVFKRMMKMSRMESFKKRIKTFSNTNIYC
jgi:hypothetical protein